METQENQVTVINAGIRGNNTSDLLIRVDKDILDHDPELVVMMVGTNDMLNLPKILTLMQYESNYQELITKIKKKSKLLLITIPPVDNESITKRIGRDLYGLSSKERVDVANTIIKRLALKNKCDLIDLNLILTACGGATENNESIFQNMANTNAIDGLHPTKSGYLTIGSVVYQAIACFMPNVKRIFCFGDSITFGYRMAGEGKVIGDSYPAVLNRILNSTK